MLKGAKKRTSNFLAIPVAEEPAGRLAAQAKAMAAGNPGKALVALRAIEADEKSVEAEKTGATAVTFCVAF